MQLMCAIHLSVSGLTPICSPAQRLLPRNANDWSTGSTTLYELSWKYRYRSNAWTYGNHTKLCHLGILDWDSADDFCHFISHIGGQCLVASASLAINLWLWSSPGAKLPEWSFHVPTVLRCTQDPLSVPAFFISHAKKSCKNCTLPTSWKYTSLNGNRRKGIMGQCQELVFRDAHSDPHCRQKPSESCLLLLLFLLFPVMYQYAKTFRKIAKITGIGVYQTSKARSFWMHKA